MTEQAARLGTALADRYRIERELGQGGMATVYLAEDLRHDRRVAIKVLRPELAAVIGGERFLAEIKTTANLQHPHILGLFDSGEANGTIFYVMPFVEGESLRDRLRREGQLPVDEAIRIATEVAAALDYAHRHGVVHRDVKPENILLHDNSAVVADFGIALALSRSNGASRLTETGMSLGTPHYMSPEQAMGDREIGPRSDVYALGCVVYEMLAGEPPFTGPNAQAIVARVMTEEPRSLTLQRKSVPPHVDAAVRRALEKLPADRFATAHEFAEALMRPDARTVAMPAAARPARGRRLGPATLIPWAVAIVALAAAGWQWVEGARPGRPAWQYGVLSDTIGIPTNLPSIALSADGELLAFKDIRQNGLIWIKRRDELEPTPLAGTERGNGMAFSPNQQWLAYLADLQLKKIRVGGGSPVMLADSTAPDGYKVAWLDDGTIVYTGFNGDVLLRVPEDGGRPEVALADSTLRGYGLLNLSPLPGSRGVLFTSCASGCVTSTIRVLDLRTGTQKLLVDDASEAWYVPTGHLLYVRRDGTARAAPFDLGKLEITGAAVPVLENVLSGNPATNLDFSRSGSLVYMRGSGGGDVADIVRVTRDGAASVVDSGWSGAFNSTALSPDGRRLAVGVGRQAGTLSIWIKQLDRGTFSRLSFGGQDRRPAWSPDGRTLAFVRDKGNGGSVYARNADGSGGDRLLGQIDRPVQEVTWSPDGRWLVVRTDNGSAGAGDLVGIPVDRPGQPVAFMPTPFTEIAPAVSPDSKWIAFQSTESGTNEVYVRSFPDMSGGRWQVSNGGGIQPAWSADGKELFYIDGDRRLVAASVNTATGFTVTGLHPLFEVRGYQLDDFHRSYDVERDGRSFLFSRQRTAAGFGGFRLVMVDNWFANLRARMRR